MLKNKEIIECAEIIHALNQNDHFQLPLGYETVFEGGGHDNIPIFKLLCNQDRKAYVVWVKCTDSFFFKDCNKIIQSSKPMEQFENGQCDQSSYFSACEIIKIIRYKFDNPNINRMFCIGLYDGGAVSAVIAEMINNGTHELIKNAPVFQRFTKDNVAGIIFGGPPTFSTKINLKTQLFIKNFILKDDNVIKQDCLEKNIPFLSMLINSSNEINSSRLPGNLIFLDPPRTEEDGFIIRNYKKIKNYVSTADKAFNKYHDAITKLIHDDEVVFDVELFKIELLELSLGITPKSKTHNAENKPKQQGNENKHLDENQNIHKKEHKNHFNISSVIDKTENIDHKVDQINEEDKSISMDDAKEMNCLPNQEKNEKGENSSFIQNVSKKNCKDITKVTKTSEIKEKECDENMQSFKNNTIKDEEIPSEKEINIEQSISKQKQLFEDSPIQEIPSEKEINIEQSISKQKQLFEDGSIQEIPSEKEINIEQSISKQNKLFEDSPIQEKSIEQPILSPTHERLITHSSKSEKDQSLQMQNTVAKESKESFIETTNAKHQLSNSPNTDYQISKQNDSSQILTSKEQKENELKARSQINNDEKEQKEIEIKTKPQSQSNQCIQSLNAQPTSPEQKTQNVKENKTESIISYESNRSSQMTFKEKMRIQDQKKKSEKLQSETDKDEKKKEQKQTQVSQTKQTQKTPKTKRQIQPNNVNQSKSVNNLQTKVQNKGFSESTTNIFEKMTNNHSPKANKEISTPENKNKRMRMIHANTIHLGSLKYFHEDVDELPRSRSVLLESRSTLIKSRKCELNQKQRTYTGLRFVKRRKLIEHSRPPLDEVVKYYKKKNSYCQQ